MFTPAGPAAQLEMERGQSSRIESGLNFRMERHMRKITLILAAAACVGLAVPAFAGGWAIRHSAAPGVSADGGKAIQDLSAKKKKIVIIKKKKVHARRAAPVTTRSSW